MFAITGITGHTGAVVAETLLAAGKPVRVIVRDAAKGAAWKARGAEVAVADLKDAAALAQAFRGVQGAYVLSPPDLTTTTQDEYIEGGFDYSWGAYRLTAASNAIKVDITSTTTQACPWTCFIIEGGIPRPLSITSRTIAFSSGA